MRKVSRIERGRYNVYMRLCEYNMKRKRIKSNLVNVISKVSKAAIKLINFQGHSYSMISTNARIQTIFFHIKSRFLMIITRIGYWSYLSYLMVKYKKNIIVSSWFRRILKIVEKMIIFLTGAFLLKSKIWGDNFKMKIIPYEKPRNQRFCRHFWCQYFFEKTFNVLSYTRG